MILVSYQERLTESRGILVTVTLGSVHINYHPLLMISDKRFSNKLVICGLLLFQLNMSMWVTIIPCTFIVSCLFYWKANIENQVSKVMSLMLNRSKCVVIFELGSPDGEVSMSISTPWHCFHTQTNSFTNDPCNRQDNWIMLLRDGHFMIRMQTRIPETW